MGRVRKNKRKNILIIVIEIICLIAAGFGIQKIIDKRTEKEAQIAAEEAAKQKAIQEEKEREEKQKELKQWNLLLVNQWNAIPDDFDVRTVEVEDGYVIDERILEPLKEMLSDCRDAGYSPKLVSTFRTRETQQYLYDHTSNKADTALPGHSEHECGLAADIIDAGSLGWNDPLIDEQEDMPAQKWLMEHCQDYGFILRYPKGKEDITGIIYEPWHYRYVGKEYSKEIMEKGMCLEDFINQYRITG